MCKLDSLVHDICILHGNFWEIFSLFYLLKKKEERKIIHFSIFAKMHGSINKSNHRPIIIIVEFLDIGILCRGAYGWRNLLISGRRSQSVDLLHLTIRSNPRFANLLETPSLMARHWRSVFRAGRPSGGRDSDGGGASAASSSCRRWHQ